MMSAESKAEITPLELLRAAFYIQILHCALCVRRRSTAARVGSAGWAPTLVQQRAPAALAKRADSSRALPSAHATANAALKALPAAVLSGTRLSHFGSPLASFKAKSSCSSFPASRPDTVVATG